MLNFGCFFVLCLALSSAGILELPNDLILQWKFQSSTSIAFSYTVPKSIRDEFAWVGLGFKFRHDGNSMAHADIVNIVFDQPVADSYAKESGRPDSDLSLDGTDDISPTFEVTEDGDNTVYSWVRSTDTGDEWDNPLLPNNEYYALWAFGQVDSTGVQRQHYTGNRGKVAFILTDYEEHSPQTESFLSISEN